MAQSWGPQGTYHWGSEVNSGPRYVQRDLEDQIREEHEALNNRTNQQTMATITTSGVLADLKNGYTRLKRDDLGYGSIEEKYGLTEKEVKELFQTPSLKAKKTALPKRKLEIIDDLSLPQASDSTAPTTPSIGTEPSITIMPNGLATFPVWVNDAVPSPEVLEITPDASPEDIKNSKAEEAEWTKDQNTKDSIFA